ncbi:hypothetical protein SESBI_14147 [Sesbania bispinosa]|nr:hypothetical protein SESBI_14147 [Sesbania bispinosa]
MKKKKNNNFNLLILKADTFGIINLNLIQEVIKCKRMRDVYNTHLMPTKHHLDTLY